MRTPLKLSVAGLLAASLLAGSIAPSIALPGDRSAGAVAERSHARALTSSFHRHFYRGQSYHGPWHDRGWHDRGWHAGGLAYGGAALGAGIAGALIDGSMGVAEPMVGAQDAMEAEIAYCADRFKSYDPSTGTYMGYDGYAHACPEG